MVSEKLNFILLIDDDPINNFLNTRIINRLQLAEEIKVCMNGLEALEFLTSLNNEKDTQFPDLILLDINMPVLDGFEFLKAFEKFETNKKEETRIVMLTTSSAAIDLRKVQHLGYTVINKPLTEDKITSILI